MSLYDEYMAYVAPFKGSTRHHRWSVISITAALLERRVWLSLGGLGSIYPNLYVVLCGGPGVGKTTTSNMACRFLKKLNDRLGRGCGVRFGPDKVTPAALFPRMQKATKTLTGISGCPKFEQSAIYIHSTELATIIKDIGGGSLSDDLLKLYDCDDYFEKETMKGGVIKIAGPCLNFLADTTPSFLSGYLPREESGTGLTARIIFATEPGGVDMDEEVPDGNKVLYEKILGHCARIYRMAGPFRISLEAKAWWKTWYKGYRSKLFSIPDGAFMRYFYARKPTHIRKVAMGLSASRDSSRVIGLKDLQQSIEFLEEAEPYMEKSFGVKDFRYVEDSIKQILDAIPYRPGHISRAALLHSLYYSGLSGSLADFDNMIKTLISGKLIARVLSDEPIPHYSRIA